MAWAAQAPAPNGQEEQCRGQVGARISCDGSGSTYPLDEQPSQGWSSNPRHLLSDRELGVPLAQGRPIHQGWQVRLRAHREEDGEDAHRTGNDVLVATSSPSACGTCLAMPLPMSAHRRISGLAVPTSYVLG